MAFRWQDDDGPTLNVGFVSWIGSFVILESGPVLLRNPKALWFFMGGVRPTVLPLDPRMPTNFQQASHGLELLKDL